MSFVSETVSIDAKGRLVLPDMMIMTTVAVTKEVKRRLLRVASELQLKLGRKVDLNEAISYLLTREKRRPDLLEAASRPVPGFEEGYRELIQERRKDEGRARGKFRA